MNFRVGQTWKTRDGQLVDIIAVWFSGYAVEGIHRGGVKDCWSLEGEYFIPFSGGMPYEDELDLVELVSE